MKNLPVWTAVSLVLGSVCTASLADDDHIVWSINAMSCVPTPESLKGDVLAARAGRVILEKNGSATLICPIGTISENMQKFSLRSLFMTYRDGDGNTPDSSGKVVAVLRRINRTGHVESLDNSEVSSNSRGAPNSGPEGWATHQSATSGHTIEQGLEFDKFYYYVQITLTSETGGPVGVQGIFLTT